MNHAYQKRWFVLDEQGKTLRYSTGPGEPTKGTIDLVGAIVSRRLVSKYTDAFQIETKALKRYELRAGSEEKMWTWIDTCQLVAGELFSDVSLSCNFPAV